jgi:hypothetical protein
MREHLSEEVLANKLALEQLGYYNEEAGDCETDFQERLFQARSRRGNYAAIVNDLSLRIAKAAFSSRQDMPRTKSYFSQNGKDLWQSVKETLKKPGVTEASIVGTALLLKMLLYFTYRNAALHGIPEISEL